MKRIWVGIVPKWKNQGDFLEKRERSGHSRSMVVNFICIRRQACSRRALHNILIKLQLLDVHF